MVHGAEAHPKLADLVRAVLLAPHPGTLDPPPVLLRERGVVVDIEGGTLHPLKPFFPLNFGQQRISSIAPLVQNKTDFRSFGILTVLDQFLEDKYTYYLRLDDSKTHLEYLSSVRIFLQDLAEVLRDWRPLCVLVIVHCIGILQLFLKLSEMVNYCSRF